MQKNNAETQTMQKHKQCRKQLCRNTNNAENNYAETQTVIMQKHKQ